MPTRAGVPRWGRRVPVSRCDRESRIPGSSRMIPAYPGLKLLIDLTVRAPAFEEWGHVLGDEVMAAALIDRLLHHCHIVNIRGNSYRMREHQHWLRTASDEQREGVAT